MIDLLPSACGGPAASATSAAHARRRRRGRHRGRADRDPLGPGAVARDRRGGRAVASPTSRATRTADGGSAVTTNGLLHDEVLAALAPGAAAERVDRRRWRARDRGRHRHRHVVGQGARGRRGRHVVASLARSRTRSASRPPTGSSTTPRSRGATARSPRSTRSQLDDAAGRGERLRDGADPDRGRRRRRPADAGPALRRRARAGRAEQRQPGRDRRAGELPALGPAASTRTPPAFWPATAMANHALGGEAVLDTTTASVAFPLFDWTQWDPEVAATARGRRRAAAAARADRLGGRSRRRSRRSGARAGLHRRAHRPDRRRRRHRRRRARSSWAPRSS